MSAGTPQEDIALMRGAIREGFGSHAEAEAALDRLEQRLARLEEAARPFVETWDFHAIGYVADYVDGKEIRALPATMVAELVKQQKALRRALAAEPEERAGA